MPYIGKAPASGIRSRFIYTATAAQTTFTGADGTGKTLGYTDGEYVDVYLNGVLLDPADYTATSKTSVVLDSGATVSDIVEIVVYDTFSVFNGTFTGDLTVDGDTLFVDSTNNRVGINDVTPSEELDINGDGSDVRIRMYDGAGASVGRIAHSGANFDISNTATSSATLTFTTGSGSGAERMRIDSSGQVGIGTTSADEVLEVSGDIKSSGSNFGIYHFGETSDVTKIVGRDASHGSLPNTMDFFTNSTQRIRIDSSGNVGIGTDSPTRTLYVDGQIGASGRIHTASGSATDCGLGIGDDNTGFFRAATNTIGVSTNGTERMRIDSSGRLLVGATTSVGQIATFIGGTNTTTAGTVYFGNGGGSAVFAAFGDTGNTTVYGYIQR